MGSGPAGLAAADQLNHAGHLVTVFERADRIGGLLRYGIPEFKMEKHLLDRRLALMEQEGVVFRAGMNIGVDVPVATLRKEFDAIVLCGGATAPRDLPIPGRDAAGVHFAVDYLTQQNRLCEGDTIDPAEVISAEGRRVVIIGGGDTGADCLGTAHRQGARSVAQFELMARPPDTRAADNPWPQWPTIFRSSAAHEEGGERAVLGLDRAVSRPTPTGASRGLAPSRERCASTAAGCGSCPRRRRRSKSRPTWCCSPWASPAPSAAGCSRNWAFA